jgi:uncharacterized protein (DUF433 family)
MPHMETKARREAEKPDLREQAAYGLAEAARYVKLPAATLRSWVAGREYPRAKGVGHFPPLIHPPRKQPPVLSFWNLIEAHVLRSLRTEHGVSLKELRQALGYAERTLQVERLLLRKELRTDAGKVFLDRYGELIELSASGQIAMRMLFEEHLKRVEWDEWKFPVRLYPFVSADTPAPRTIAIDPKIAFGRPVIARAGISTAAIAARIDAKEPASELAADYDLTVEEIEQAVLYERAA